MTTVSRETIEKGLDILRELNNSKFITHVNSCVHCGLCGESCMYYLANREPKNLPAYKVELISSLYRKYFTFIGKHVPDLVRAKELDDKMIEEMVDVFFGRCTMCGRCNFHCSIGVDIAYLTKVGRIMLTEMGYTPANLQSTVDAAIKTGNNMAITTEEFVDTLNWLEEDLQDDLNDPNAKIHVNEQGKELMYTLNPREPKFFPLSISAMAKVFYAAKESWTLSTKMYDVTNYAFFSGNSKEAQIIAQRMVDEVKSLGIKRLILAECGHGDRAFRWEAPNFLSQKFDFDVITSVELLAEYIRTEKIKVTTENITDLVTLHDPCNLSRNGGIFEEQRFILKNTVKNFVEMNPCGINNLCCGGGGGQLAMSEYNERRMSIGKLKADQIRNTGAKIVVTPCHNCVDQLLQLNSAYKLNVQIKTLAEIVADALILEN
ncbi:MAG TPA: (Fe-S)-binding protein [Bacteroidales bacterium]|nr:(Fe-S)-binding protein [Bacteroidales bacterium]